MYSQTFEHLHGHLLWHSGLVDTISCGLDHHSKSPGAQFLTWIAQVRAVTAPSLSPDWTVYI